MIFLIISVVVLLIITLISIYLVRISMKKFEYYYSQFILSNSIIEKLYQRNIEDYNKVKELDVQGYFESDKDDNVSMFFKTVKKNIEEVNEYFNRINKDQNEEKGE